MRNLKRLEFEIKILEKTFGWRNISYPSDGSWIKINRFRLPQKICRYNLRFAVILIIIPYEYDIVGVSECYIDMDLRIKKGMVWDKLPHTHEKGYEEEGYQWLCFEASIRFISLLDFINTLNLYFTDPFRYQRL